MRRISELVKRARAVKVHAYIIHYLRKQIAGWATVTVWNKTEKQAELIASLDREFVMAARRYNLPREPPPPSLTRHDPDRIPPAPLRRSCDIPPPRLSTCVSALVHCPQRLATSPALPVHAVNPSSRRHARYASAVGDFPNVNKMRASLREIKDLRDVPRLNKNLIFDMDKMFTADIPRLLESASQPANTGRAKRGLFLD